MNFAFSLEDAPVIHFTYEIYNHHCVLIVLRDIVFVWLFPPLLVLRHCVYL